MTILSTSLDLTLYRALRYKMRRHTPHRAAKLEFTFPNWEQWPPSTIEPDLHPVGTKGRSWTRSSKASNLAAFRCPNRHFCLIARERARAEMSGVRRFSKNIGQLLHQRLYRSTLWRHAIHYPKSSNLGYASNLIALNLTERLLH